MPIVEVLFEGEKSSIQHLKNVLKDADINVFKLGESARSPSGGVSHYFYVDASTAAEAKKQIKFWLNERFRSGTPNSPSPEVEISRFYVGELSRILEGVSAQVDTELEARIRQYETDLSRLNAEVAEKEIALKQETERCTWAVSEVEKLQDFSLKHQEYEEQQKAAKKLNGELDKENSSLKQALDDNYKTIRGLTDNYSKKNQQVKDLQEQLEERRAAVTPYDIRVAEVSQSAANLKLVEQELKNSGLTDKLADLTGIPQSLLAFVSQSFGGAVYENEDEIYDAANAKYELTEEDRQDYLNAKKTVKFYETVKAQGIEIPTEIAPMISQLESALEDKKTLIMAFEGQEKAREDGLKRAAKLQDLISEHKLSLEARRILARLPKLEIYVHYNEDGSSETYAPIGMENGIVYGIFKNFLGEAPKVDEYGVSKIITPFSKDNDFESSLLDIKHDLNACFKNVVIHKDSEL
ncbi:MAG: hypothetical protein V1839_01725 [archaeon]